MKLFKEVAVQKTEIKAADFKQIRLKLEYSARQFAKVLGISHTFITMLESGVWAISSDRAKEVEGLLVKHLKEKGIVLEGVN